jgi:hypothetical protein
LTFHAKTTERPRSWAAGSFLPSSALVSTVRRRCEYIVVTRACRWCAADAQGVIPSRRQPVAHPRQCGWTAERRSEGVVPSPRPSPLAIHHPDPCLWPHHRSTVRPARVNWHRVTTSCEVDRDRACGGEADAPESNEVAARDVSCVRSTRRVSDGIGSGYSTTAGGSTVTPFLRRLIDLRPR